MRERIDVSEIEAKTKIRAKYLRALENEEWDLLPGPTFVKTLPAHLRAGAGPRRQGAPRGIQAELRAPRGRRGVRAIEARTAAHVCRGALPQQDRPASTHRGRWGARGGGTVPRSGPSRGYLAAVAGVGSVDRAAAGGPALGWEAAPADRRRATRPASPRARPRQAPAAPPMTMRVRHRRPIWPRSSWNRRPKCTSA